MRVAFFRDFRVGQHQHVAHEVALMEVGPGDGCELHCSELDVSPTVLLGDEGDVAEVAEQVVDTLDTKVLLDVKAEYR